MSLSSLPAEVKLHIVEHLDPIPTLHLALASKEHLNLVQKHLELFVKYHTIKPSRDGFCIWDLTKEILQDPRKGWYVRDLNLVANRPECHEDLPEEDKTLFKAAAERILPIYCHQSSFFLEQGHLDDLEQSLSGLDVWTEEAAVLVLLLHHLPELRIFKMTDTRTHDFLEAFMRRVAEGYQNPALAAKMPLQQLRTAAIAHYDTEFFCHIDWAVYFMCVPSLRTFTALMMGSEGITEFYTGEDDGTQDDPGEESYLRNTATTPVSNVEELVFTQCQFDPQSFNTLLPMIKNLKSFSYEAGGSTVSYSDYQARKVIKALANHTSHSLEELELTECEIGYEGNEEDIAFAPARAFKKLKALRCEARWLLPAADEVDLDGEALSQGFHSVEEEVAEYISDPRDNLPASIEYLCLDGNYCDEEWQKMRQIFKKDNANTPKLNLGNTCLVRSGGRFLGRAVKPEVRFERPHLANIWSGHGGG